MEMIMIKDAAKDLGVESHVLRYWEEELGLEIKRNSMGHRYYDARDIKMFREVKDLRDRGFSLKDIREGIEKQKEKLKEEAQAPIEGRGNVEACVAHGVVDKGAVETGGNVTTTGVKGNGDNVVTTGAMGSGDDVTTTEAKRNGGNMTTTGVKGNGDDVTTIGTSHGQASESNQLKIVDFKTAQMQTLMNKIVANALRENKDIITSSIKSELTSDVMRQFDTVMREKEEKEEERYRKLDETIRLMQRSNEEVAATQVKRGLFGKRKKK